MFRSVSGSEHARDATRAQKWPQRAIATSLKGAFNFHISLVFRAVCSAVWPDILLPTNPRSPVTKVTETFREREGCYCLASSSLERNASEGDMKRLITLFVALVVGIGMSGMASAQGKHGGRPATTGLE